MNDNNERKSNLLRSLDNLKQGQFVLPLFFVSNRPFLTFGVKFVTVSNCGAVKLFIHSCWMQKSGFRVIQSQPKPYFHVQICSKSVWHGKSCQFVQDRACIPDPHLISGFLINHRCPRLLLYCPLIISVYLGDVVHYELRSNSFASPRLPRYDHALVLAV